MSIKPLVIFLGECNACGFVSTRYLTTEEHRIHPEVKIFNNNTEVVEDLDINNNNYIGTATLEDYRNFGWEVFLPNQVVAGRWQPYAVDVGHPLYVLKAAEGGIKSNSYLKNQEFYYLRFLNRYKKTIEQIGEVKPVIWLSHGANELELEEVAAYKGNIYEFFDRIRTDLPDVPIVMTKQPLYSIALDPIVEEIAEEYPLVSCIDVTYPNICRFDAQHWNRAGMEYIAEQFRIETLKFWNV